MTFDFCSGHFKHLLSESRDGLTVSWDEPVGTMSFSLPAENDDTRCPKPASLPGSEP